MELQQVFFRAIKAGDNVKVQKLLIENSALVNAHDENGLSAVMTALYYQNNAIADVFVHAAAHLDIFEACAVGQIERVAQLLESDPDLANAFASDGFQPLGLACFFGRLEVVQVLLQRGAGVNIASRNPIGVMPLHSAVAGQHLEIARALLGAGAAANAQQVEQFTPLHGAAQNGQVEMVDLLFQYGASPNPRNTAGQTPLTLALEGGYQLVADLIRGHGGKE